MAVENSMPASASVATVTDENLNVLKVTMTEFKSQLVDRLKGLLDCYARGVDDESSAYDRQDYIGATHPILVIGPPGVGKSTILSSCIKEMNEYIDELKKEDPEFKDLPYFDPLYRVQLGQTIIGELNGIPTVVTKTDVNGNTIQEVKQLHPNYLPIEGKDDGRSELGILLLDEFTTAEGLQTNPAFSLADESRSINGAKLKKYVLVVLAGNGPDASNFVSLSATHMNRTSVLSIQYDYKNDWRKWAVNNYVRPEIIAYLDSYPQNILAYAGDSESNTKSGRAFASPRSWYSLSCDINNVLRERKTKLKNEVSPFHNMQNDPAVFADFKLWLQKIACEDLGVEVGQSFASNVAATYNLNIRPLDILEGTQGPVKKPLTNIEMAYIINSIMNLLNREIEEVMQSPKYDSQNLVDSLGQERLKHIKNSFDWVLNTNTTATDSQYQFIKTFLEANPDLINLFSITMVDLFKDDQIVTDFLNKHKDLLQGNTMDKLNNVKANNKK